MITYDVKITIKVYDHQYDSSVKGQGKIYLKYVLPLLKRTLLPFFFDQGCSNLAQ